MKINRIFVKCYHSTFFISPFVTFTKKWASLGVTSLVHTTKLPFSVNTPLSSKLSFNNLVTKHRPIFVVVSFSPRIHTLLKSPDVKLKDFAVFYISLRDYSHAAFGNLSLFQTKDFITVIWYIFCVQHDNGQKYNHACLLTSSVLAGLSVDSNGQVLKTCSVRLGLLRVSSFRFQNDARCRLVPDYFKAGGFTTRWVCRCGCNWAMRVLRGSLEELGLPWCLYNNSAFCLCSHDGVWAHFPREKPNVYWNWGQVVD